MRVSPVDVAVGTVSFLIGCGMVAAGAFAYWLGRAGWRQWHRDGRTAAHR